MKKSVHAAEAGEGAPVVTPVRKQNIEAQLRAELVARFGEPAVASA